MINNNLHHYPYYLQYFYPKLTHIPATNYASRSHLFRLPQNVSPDFTFHRFVRQNQNRSASFFYNVNPTNHNFTSCYTNDNNNKTARNIRNNKHNSNNSSFTNKTRTSTNVYSCSNNSNINVTTNITHSTSTQQQQQQQQRQQMLQAIDTQQQQQHNTEQTNTANKTRRKPQHLETETVINLSTATLNKDEHSLLSRGLNFCPTPKNIDWNELNADLNDFKRRLRLKHYFQDKAGQDETQTEHDENETTHEYKKPSNWTPARNLDPALDYYINSIERDIKDIQPTKVSDNLTKNERDALSRLAKRSDIVIKPADKGSGTVIMDKQFYTNECYRQLNDTTFYEKLDVDMTNKVTKTVTQYLQLMKRKEHITKDT